MMRLTITLLLLLLSVTLVQAASAVSRSLEDENNGGNNVDLSGYSLKFDKCVRVKIPDDNDDEEGNSYFYNGAYRSQSQAYGSFYVCTQGDDMEETCDTSKAYLMDLEDSVDSAVEYMQNYCNACANQCGYRRLGEEDEGEDQQGEEEQQMQANCYTCAEECTLLRYGNEGNDETQYLNCQAAVVDDNGLQYYSAPTCTQDGHLIMGLFYDEDCTIKKNEDTTGFGDNFAYNSFLTFENAYMDCSMSELCENALVDGGALECMDGFNVNENQDDSNMNVCKTYKKVSKEWQYAKAKRQSPVPILVVLLLFLSCFLFLSYTYYVRHNKANQNSTKTALMEAEQQQAGTRQPDAVATDFQQAPP